MGKIFVENDFVVFKRFIILILTLVSISSYSSNKKSIYHWVPNPQAEAKEYYQANERLGCAISDPEYLLTNWINLPIAPAIKSSKLVKLSLNEAILLSLRYNPNVQNAELDRIIQRYQLRVTQNEFELRYALAASANFEKSRYSGVGSASTQAYIATPELDWKSQLGTQLSLKMDNNVQTYNSYNPTLNFSITQPLLRGFGLTVNQVSLLNAYDAECLNQLNLKQSVMDQITTVIKAYRNLILSGHNLENTRRQLSEAKQTFELNKKRISAGQLEPTGNIQESYQIESISLLVEQGENDFKIAGQQLLAAIGLDPNMNIQVPSDVNVDKVYIPNTQKSINIALAQNAQYQALKLAVKADKRALEVAKNQQLWQLDLSANVQSGQLTSVDGNGMGLKGIYDGRNINQSARVTFSVPINDLGRRKQLIDAKVRLEKDRISLKAAERDLVTHVKNSINTIESQARRFKLAQKQVSLAKKSYELEKKKQQAGIASALDVNNTQNQLIQAQTGLISAKIAYLNELSALQRFLGTTLDYWHIDMRYGK